MVQKEMLFKVVALCVALVITVTAVGIGFRQKEPPIDSVIESSDDSVLSTSDSNGAQSIIYGETTLSNISIGQYATNTETLYNPALISGRVNVKFNLSDSTEYVYYVIMYAKEQYLPVKEPFYKQRLETIKDYCLNHSEDFTEEAMALLKEKDIDEAWIEKYGFECWSEFGCRDCNGQLDYEGCFEEYFKTNGRRITEDYPKNDKYGEEFANYMYHMMCHFDMAVEEYAMLGIEAEHRGYGVYTAYITAKDIEKLKTTMIPLEIECLDREYSDEEWKKWEATQAEIYLNPKQVSQIG